MNSSQRLPFGGRPVATSSKYRRSHTRSAQLPPPAGVVTRSGSALIIKFSRPHHIWRQALLRIDGVRRVDNQVEFAAHIGHIRDIRSVARRFGWHMSEHVDRIPDLGPADFPIVVAVDGEHLVVELPWRDDIHPTLSEYGTYNARVGRWFIPAEHAIDTVLDLQRHDNVRLRLDGDLGEAITRATKMLALSRAMEPSPAFQLTDAVVRDLSTRPFQLAGVEYGVMAVQHGAGCFLWGTMGSGKTTVSLAVMEQLAQMGHAVYPLLVVPPSGIKTNWEREVRAVIPHRSTWVCEGMTPALPLEQPDIWIANYDILGKVDDGSWADAFMAMGLNGMIVDEGHRCKELRSLRTIACMSISESLAPHSPRLLLTGTPVRNKREEVLAQLVVIGRGSEQRDPETGKTKIVTQFGDRKQIKEDERLSRRLRTVCAWRPDPTEVLQYLGLIGDDESADVPENYILVDGEPRIMAKYRHAEERFLEYLRQKAEEKARELGLDPHSAGVRAVMRASSAAQLMQVNELARLAGLAKVRAAKEWISDFLTTGEKLLVFAHHRDVMNDLAGDKLPQIHGDVKHADRMVLVDRFQEEAGDPLQAMVLQTDAAGEGLTLTKAYQVMHAELEWVPGAHDQANARAAWRMNDPHNILANYLVCANTIDEMRVGVLQRKREEMAVVTDGDRESIAKESTYGAVFEQLLKKALGDDSGSA